MRSLYKLGASVWVIILLLTFSCRQEADPPAPKVKNLQFEVETLSLGLEETVTVKITADPKEALKGRKIDYNTSTSGIVELDTGNSSNDGIVFKGIAAGTTVITAKIDGIVDYISIEVNGGAEAGIPYISLTDNVIELLEGQRKSVIANVQEGSILDNNGFTFVNGDERVVAMESANNVVTLEGLHRGSTIITVSHPKTQYSVDIVVMVVNEGETAKYITADENVAVMMIGEKDRAYYTRLVGCEDSDKSRTFYEVTEGSNSVRVTGSGEFCYLEAVAEGAAKVTVTNEAVPNPFVFQVIVNNPKDTMYIEVDNNFVILDGEATERIRAKFAGLPPDDYKSRYTYKIDNPEIVDVVQTDDLFTLKGRKNGKTILTLSNEYSDFSREILIMVNNIGVTPDTVEPYITTSQNVIQMELGSDALLKMMLVNGIESDRNGFEWVVDDSSVIDVQSVTHGTVRYVRSVIESNDKGDFEAQAVIKAKKLGSTIITVYNSKTKNESMVLVKVYPRGTFSSGAVVLGGPSIIKIKVGDEATINTPILQGKETELGVTEWTAADDAIAEVTGSGLWGTVKGNSRGITKLRVNGSNMVNPFETVVVVVNDYEDSLPYIYTENLFYRLYTGQTVYFSIFHPSVSDNEFKMQLTNSNTDIVYHTNIRDRIIVNAVQPGEGELRITVDGCNDLTIKFIIENEKIDPDRPYLLTGDNFAGTTVGGTVNYKITMAGGESELGKLMFSIEDTTIMAIDSQADNEVILRGLKEGQTIMRVSHLKSTNVKDVIVYVSKAGIDPNNILVLGLETVNYVIRENESLFLRIITNTSKRAEIEKIVWKVDNTGIADVMGNHDTVVITGLAGGNCKVTAYTDDGSHLMDLVIFITVKSGTDITQNIGLPASVVLIKGQHKIITPNFSNIAWEELRNVEWNIEDSSIISLVNNTNEITIKGEKAGQTFINVGFSKIGFYKKMLVICVERETDLSSLYYFTVEKNFYRIKKGDEAKVNLLFGENGFPEEDQRAIEWEVQDGNNVVTINAQGGRAAIIGNNAGVTRIAIKSRHLQKPVEITFEVSETGYGSDEYYFKYTPIHSMTKGDVPLFIPISIYYGNNALDEGYTDITVSRDDNTIVNAAMAGQTLRVEGLQAGRTIIHLTHSLISEPAHIMIMVYEEDEIPFEFTIFVPKTHYLLHEGESKSVGIYTNHADGIYNDRIQWINRNPDLIMCEPVDTLNATITSFKSGNGIIDIEYNGSVVGTIYVSISGNKESKDVEIVTESIIVLSLEQESYMTKAICSGITVSPSWDIIDTRQPDEPYIVELYPSGSDAILTPISVGTTEIKVSYGNVIRTIVVIVCATESEKYDICAMNIDKRYYTISKGDNLILNPYYKIKQPSNNASYKLVNDNNVLTIDNTDSKYNITAKNIGIEQIEVVNESCGYNKSVLLTFEVVENLSGTVVGTSKNIYLTTDDNIMVMSPNDTNLLAQVNVIGEYTYNAKDFAWVTDNDLITIEGFGKEAILHAGKQTGETTIRVVNQYCNNYVEIKVIISEIPQTGIKEAYIYVKQNVVELDVSDPAIYIPYEIRNSENADHNSVMLACNSGIIQHNVHNRNIVITPIRKGTAVIEVLYSDLNLSTKIYVVVKNSNENNAVFLTTVQNYIIVPKGQSKTVDINLINYTELNSSNITWTSENTGIAQVVGNGPAVNVIGTSTGITKITAKHGKAYNDLDIVVKVSETAEAGDLCYLTTNDNVIETYVSTLSNTITVEKIGGLPSFEGTWTNDNPTVVGLTGNGNEAYFTAKKEGVARISLTEKEAGTVSMVVIVRTAKEGSFYIEAPQQIVTIQPGMNNTQLAVNLVGGNDKDQQDFRWEIYNQIPSDVYAAQSGASVINMYANGNTATINADYEGTARIRVSHDKANERRFIVVQVTNYVSMAFESQEVSMVAGDFMPVPIQIPSYEDFTGKVSYTADNSAICTVTGTKNVVLINAISEGRTRINAVVEGTGLKASMNVVVEKEIDLNVIDIQTPRNIYVVSPRELPFVVSAQLSGNIQEAWNDELIWKITTQPAGKDRKILDFFPATGKGKEIQFIVNNRTYIQDDSDNIAVIEISCPLRTDRKRYIVVQVQEPSNAFTLDQEFVRMGTAEMKELTCNIIGGTNNDYDQVLWQVTRNQNDMYEDAVRIMGKGKTINLYGIADGVCYIIAHYKSLKVQCEVRVEAKNYFRFKVTNVTWNPGYRNLDNSLPRVSYEVRPNNAEIQWIETSSETVSGGPKEPIVKWNHLATEKAVEFEPVREGTFTLMGIAANQRSSVQIRVVDSYSFSLINENVDLNLNTDGSASATVTYYMSPPTAEVKLLNSAHVPHGIEVTIQKPEATGTGSNTVKGTITVSASRELTRSQNHENGGKGLQIPVALFRPAGGSKAGVPDLNIYVQAFYAGDDVTATPTFIRGYGKYSNSISSALHGTKGELVKDKPEPIEGKMQTPYKLVIGDGELHHIVFEKQNQLASMSDFDATDIPNGEKNIHFEKQPNIENGKFTDFGVSYDVVKMNGKDAIVFSGRRDYILFPYLGSKYDFTLNFYHNRMGSPTATIVDELNYRQDRVSIDAKKYEPSQGTTTGEQDEYGQMTATATRYTYIKVMNEEGNLIDHRIDSETKIWKVGGRGAASLSPVPWNNYSGGPNGGGHNLNGGLKMTYSGTMYSYNKNYGFKPFIVKGATKNIWDEDIRTLWRPFTGIQSNLETTTFQTVGDHGATYSIVSNTTNLKYSNHSISYVGLTVDNVDYMKGTYSSLQGKSPWQQAPGDNYHDSAKISSATHIGSYRQYLDHLDTKENLYTIASISHNNASSVGKEQNREILLRNFRDGKTYRISTTKDAALSKYAYPSIDDYETLPPEKENTNNYILLDRPQYIYHTDATDKYNNIGEVYFVKGYSHKPNGFLTYEAILAYDFRENSPYKLLTFQPADFSIKSRDYDNKHHMIYLGGKSNDFADGVYNVSLKYPYFNDTFDTLYTYDKRSDDAKIIIDDDSNPDHKNTRRYTRSYLWINREGESKKLDEWADRGKAPPLVINRSRLNEFPAVINLDDPTEKTKKYTIRMINEKETENGTSEGDPVFYPVASQYEVPLNPGEIKLGTVKASYQTSKEDVVIYINVYYEVRQNSAENVSIPYDNSKPFEEAVDLVKPGEIDKDPFQDKIFWNDKVNKEGVDLEGQYYIAK